jgi:hypothetical protein
MSDNSNNEKVNLDKRFSDEESISDYIPIVYELTEDEIIKNGGQRHIIGFYCRCKDKNKCDCVKKIKLFFNC